MKCRNTRKEFPLQYQQRFFKSGFGAGTICMCDSLAQKIKSPFSIFSIGIILVKVTFGEYFP